MSSYNLCETLVQGLLACAKTSHERSCLNIVLDRIKSAHDAHINANQPHVKVPNGAKINIGAGLNWNRDGWVSLDKYASPGKNVVVCDILYGDLPKVFEIDSVNAIYSTHTLEHFTYEEVFVLLRDCFRIMKPGSPIRLVTPDLDILVDKLYHKDLDWWGHNEIQFHKDAHRLNEYEMSWNFCKSIGVQMNSKYELRTLKEVIRGYHYSVFNFSILSEILKNLGFSNIQKSTCNGSQFKVFNDLDNREICSLYVEATKP